MRTLRAPKNLKALQSLVVAVLILSMTTSSQVTLGAAHSNTPLVLKTRAIAPADASEKAPLLELIHATKSDPENKKKLRSFKSALSDRLTGTLPKMVMNHFPSVIGSTLWLSVVLSEAINTSPNLGNLATTPDAWNSVAYAFGELYGSLPETGELSLKDRIDGAWQGIVDAEERAENADNETKEFLRVGSLTGNEAKRILEDPEEYERQLKSGEIHGGNSDRDKLLRAFGEKFLAKIKKNKEHSQLVDQASNGDEAARKKLIEMNPITLLTYLAQVKEPKALTKLVKALASKDTNGNWVLTLWDRANEAIALGLGKSATSFAAALRNFNVTEGGGIFSLRSLAPVKRQDTIDSEKAQVKQTLPPASHNSTNSSGASSSAPRQSVSSSPSRSRIVIRPSSGNARSTPPLKLRVSPNSNSFISTAPRRIRVRANNNRNAVRGNRGNGIANRGRAGGLLLNSSEAALANLIRAGQPAQPVGVQNSGGGSSGGGSFPDGRCLQCHDTRSMIGKSVAQLKKGAKDRGGITISDAEAQAIKDFLDSNS